jgi:phosphonate transport system substrate-binding protein
MIHPRMFGVALTSATLSACVAAPVRNDDGQITRTLLFGITTYSGSRTGEIDAQALGRCLTKAVGQRVQVLGFSDETSLGEALALKGVDAAWMPPLAFSRARAHSLAVPIAKPLRHGRSYYRGAFFTRADRALHTLKDLEGKKVAWVDQRSAAGYLYPRALITEAQLNAETYFSQQAFEEDHAAVCRAVLEGRADVGATFIDDHPDGTPLVDGCVQAVGPGEASKLVVVLATRPIPNDIVAIREGLSPATAAALRGAFLRLDQDEEGKSVLAHVFNADAFTESTLDDVGL